MDEYDNSEGFLDVIEFWYNISIKINYLIIKLMEKIEK